MDTSQRLALLADELRAISANGLCFARNPYDEANYRQVRRIAAEIFALVDNRPLPAIEQSLSHLLGHYTPMVMGDALVINEEGEILLIQRADSRLWAAPGGAFDVGETAAEGVVRECREETGWLVEPISLIGVYDSRLLETRVQHHVYHVSFLCRPLAQTEFSPSHAGETLDIGWFRESRLPPLDRGHHVWVPNAFRAWRGNMTATYFDRGG
jgi:ADP-ribose pyrophosphatase YjhB (NUDIX family)